MSCHGFFHMGHKKIENLLITDYIIVVNTPIPGHQGLALARARGPPASSLLNGSRILDSNHWGLAGGSDMALVHCCLGRMRLTSGQCPAHLGASFVADQCLPH
jgi:hypothetical protein